MINMITETFTPCDSFKKYVALRDLMDVFAEASHAIPG